MITCFSSVPMMMVKLGDIGDELQMDMDEFKAAVDSVHYRLKESRLLPSHKRVAKQADQCR